MSYGDIFNGSYYLSRDNMKIHLEHEHEQKMNVIDNIHQENMDRLSNERNRDTAMQKALQWQNVVTSGQYKDANGNTHQATPDEITYAQMMYGQALQEAYLYHSQLLLYYFYF